MRMTKDYEKHFEDHPRQFFMKNQNTNACIRSVAVKILSVGLLLMLSILCALGANFAPDAKEKTTLLKTPGEGIQPQVAVDQRGTVHLIYFRGDPAAGEIFYVRKNPADNDFSSPIRVNSLPGSAVAIGTVRGAHIALGRMGRVHVAWLGSKAAVSALPFEGIPMLYTRLDDDRKAFEPQRNIVQFAVGLDGGGSVAADDSGNVYVCWHAGAGVRGEDARRVWVARSTDDGQTFSREEPASADTTGTCGCCGMRAFADRAGTVYMLYRAATAQIHRDMYLLVSLRGQGSFRSTRLHEWTLNACPMSTESISETGTGVLLTWETAGQVYYGKVDPQKSKVSAVISAPGDGGKRKHPVVAGNAQGETILAWTEGTAWNRGGSFAWQVFDKNDRPTQEKGLAPGVPVWSLVAVFARPDGGFTIVY